MNYRNYFLPVALVAAMSAQAQNTYLNETVANTTGDVIGTARYVGMGGAMGALGADLNTMSWNPAGTGLYRKNDLSLTFGGLWGKSRIDNENAGTGSFDQIGFLYSFKTDEETCPYINFGINYQKKANYNYNYYADNNNLRGLSQTDQIAELVTDAYDSDDNLAGMMFGHNNDYGYFENRTVTNADGTIHDYYANPFNANRNEFTHHSEGAMHGYDFNVSANIKDRAYLGFTLGVDQVSYRGWSEYYEERVPVDASYNVYNDFMIKGSGINFKLGTIIRPIEDSPFRFGLAVESPTWFRLKNSTVFNLSNTTGYESYLEYTMRTPWKLRASLGSTVGTSFAWDVDYEYANYGSMKMGYPKWDEYDSYHSSYSNDTDPVMNKHTKETLKGVHTIRAGAEYRPVSAVALRVGYNYITPSYEKNSGFDQWSLDCIAMDFATSTHYMHTGATNILTLGVGYRYKAFYIDMAYKVRNQKGDFYAFDTNFTNEGTDFSADNPSLKGKKLDPVEVDLTRQQISCTLGFKF